MCTVEGVGADIFGAASDEYNKTYPSLSLLQLQYQTTRYLITGVHYNETVNYLPGHFGIEIGADICELGAVPLSESLASTRASIDLKEIIPVTTIQCDRM